MATVVWTALSYRFGRLLSWHPRHPEGGRQKAPCIVAIVPTGPIRFLLQSISRDAGWPLTLSETPLITASARRVDVPPIIVYDRDLSPDYWREIINVLAKSSPRPYVILVSQCRRESLGRTATRGWLRHCARSRHSG
jgi:hypothetical protein